MGNKQVSPPEYEEPPKYEKPIYRRCFFRSTIDHRIYEFGSVIMPMEELLMLFADIEFNNVGCVSPYDGILKYLSSDGSCILYIVMNTPKEISKPKIMELLLKNPKLKEEHKKILETAEQYDSVKATCEILGKSIPEHIDKARAYKKNYELLSVTPTAPPPY